jgi:flavin-dependent dehydrogenase
MGVMQKMRDPIVAVRSYFEGVNSNGSFEFFFEKELLPGYGWVFPLPDGRANVGIGVFGESLRHEKPPINALFDQFLALPRIQQRLAGAKEVGPRRSHPLRDDYPLHDIIGDGWLIAGESAGIVHPVTGEGIDLAIESAELAAETILGKKAGFAWTKKALAPYDRAMLRTFKRTFEGARLLQRMAITEKMFDRVVWRAAKHEAFARVALRINLGLNTPLAILQPKVMWSILYPKIMGLVTPVFAKSR